MADAADEGYGPFACYAFTVNYILGVGCLAMPLLFERAGVSEKRLLYSYATCGSVPVANASCDPRTNTSWCAGKTIAAVAMVFGIIFLAM